MSIRLGLTRKSTNNRSREVNMKTEWNANVPVERLMRKASHARERMSLMLRLYPRVVAIRMVSVLSRHIRTVRSEGTLTVR
jgi:hypothetical protein